MKYSVEISCYQNFTFDVDAVSEEEAEDKAIEMAKAELAKTKDFDLDIESVDKLEEA